MINQNAQFRKKPQEENYVCQTSQRIRQILQYVKQNWISLNSQNTNKEYHPNLRKTQSLKINSLGRGTKSLNENKPPLINYHHSYGRSFNYEYQKLKIVNEFLLQVQTNLEEISQTLQNICSSIQKYEFLQSQQKLNKVQINKSCKQSHKLQRCQNYKNFQQIFSYILKYFFAENLSSLINQHPKKIALYLLSIETKLSILPDMIQSAYTFQPDITTENHNIPKYSHIWKKIRVVEMESQKNQIQNQLNLLKIMMRITTSAVVTQNYTVNLEILKKMVFGLSFPYFLLADEQSELRCYRIWRNPKVQNLNSVWNLPEKGAISQCKKLMFQSIQTCFFIHIPVNKQQNLNQNQKQNRSKIKMRTKNNFPDIFTTPVNPEQSIRVLVLYSGRFRFYEMFKHFQPFTLFSCWNVPEQINLQTIMIHLHGGGFVSLSSQTTQSYTRKWANALNIPIFSIDYRKPPKFRFPTALEDCATVYEFLIENIYKYFNVRPTNVILTGDSAGGNLAVSLCALLLKRKYPILPSALFLAYPAVDLRVRYSPSRLNSFNDPILLPPLLFLCLRQYLGGNSSLQSDPFASPILLTQYFIQTGKQPTKQTFQQLKKWPKNWPKTTIMVGKKDPLYDDSLRLMQKLTDGGADAKLIIYNQLCHAFLSLDTMISACTQVLDDSIRQLKQLLKE